MDIAERESYRVVYVIGRLNNITATSYFYIYKRNGRVFSKDSACVSAQTLVEGIDGVDQVDTVALRLHEPLSDEDGDGSLRPLF